MQFEPLIPGAVWVTLAVAAAGGMVWYALHRPSVVGRVRWGVITGLMSLGVAVVLGILLNPTWVRELPPPAGKPLLTVLVDGSASMGTPDGVDGKTRYASAAEAAKRLNRELGERFDVRVRLFDLAPSPVDAEELAELEPVGGGTDLVSAIASSLDLDHPQGQAIVLLSDGIHNAPGGVRRVLDAARLARAMSAPVYARTFGGEVGGVDLAVELRSAQDLAIVGQKQAVTARVKHVGLGTGRATVRLLHQGQEVSQREAVLEPTAPTDVHFVVEHDEIGVYAYEVRVDSLPGEVSLANNSATYVLRVVDEPIRVLVLEGKPYWDSKFFLRTLATDQAVALDSVVRLSERRLLRRTLSRGSQETRGQGDMETRGQGGGPRMETWGILDDPGEVLASADALQNYQIVVLGRDAEVFLTEPGMTNLQHWIGQEGGALVCYRGAPAAQVSQRLASLLPVRWSAGTESRFRVRLTEQGEEMHWFSGDDRIGGDALSRLPTLATSAQVESARPLAVVLATAALGGGGQSPVVVYQPYGTGRVVVIEGAGMWRWAFLPPQYQEHEQVYAALWHSMMRWLTSGGGLLPGQMMSLRADKVRFGTNEDATVTLLVREETAGRAPGVELRVLHEGNEGLIHEGHEGTRRGGDGVVHEGREGTRRGVDGVRAHVPVAMGEETGLYRVNFGRLEEGRYEARIEGASGEDTSRCVVFDVRSYGEEHINLQARPDLMARVAEESGGRVLEGEAGREITGHFREHTARSRPAQVERISAWDRWWVLAGVFGLWGVSWALRRAGGLV